MIGELVLGQDERVGPWVCERIDKEWIPGRGKAVGLEKDGRLIAGVIVEDYTGTSCAMHVAGEGRWCSAEFIRFIFRYVFEQMKCNVVIGAVNSNNERALRFDKWLGFREAARIEGAFPNGALVLLTMRKEECRWIEHE